MNMKKAILGAIAAFAVSSAAYASTFQINPVISADIDPVTGAIKSGALGGAGISALPTKNVLPNATAGDVYAVDLYVKYTPSAGEPSFGNMTFDLNTTGGVSRLAANVGSGGNLRNRNYLPVSTQFDSDQDGTNDTTYLAFNADAGADWKAVLAGVDTTVDTSGYAIPDPRPTIGQAANPVFGSNANGFLFGRIYVQANQSGTVGQAIFQPGSGSPPSTWNAPTAGGNNQTSNPVDALGVNGLATFTVPEPTTMLVGAAFAGLGMLRRRRA